MDIMVRKVETQIIIPLRHRVLRPGLAVETAYFEDDELPTTHHFALYSLGEGPLVCASFYLTQEYGTSWQLRGMATDEKYQGRGLGRMILICGTHLLHGFNSEVVTMWCNARQTAIPFYEKMGWSRVSDLFEIKGVGPHVKMTYGL